ncbi:putative secreted protein (Por secretion system target) [Dyadobacter jiangsuensis]|uniref:Putative secreted protein (Por secretion system target) n=2 Tax=Dyadobacter jiangsuensis TaxID=1591085 RepID=A0A2P8GI96_9BACT|nr:putative secreted protein (Por secretion system target) [Dyadobacter jiangsuensis]
MTCPPKEGYPGKRELIHFATLGKTSTNHMKKIVLLVVLLFLFLTGWSQCPVPTNNNAIRFNTQAEIAAFKANYPSCTAIPGVLDITGSDITDLSGLSQITSVGRGLIIRGTSITNLRGLDNIISAGGGLQISGNGSLTSLAGLGNIADLWLRLQDNNALASLTGMEHFTTINSLSLDANLALTSLTALSNLTTVTGVIDIGVTTPVTSLAGLENLTHVGQIWLQNLYALTDISALGNLTTVDDWFYIYNCALVTDLSGLSKLEKVGDFILFGNPSLVSLKGLTSLKEITNTVTIVNNGMLSECAIKAVCDFISMPDTPAKIENNLGDCLSLDAVLDACVALPVTLINFKADEEAGQAHLYWETTEEINSGYFEIQRSSDAQNWHILGSMPAKGNSRQLNKYTFTDKYPVPSTSYYRLRSVDLDGSYSLSSIASVAMTEQNQTLIYPVPAAAGVWIEGGGLNKKVELINLRGDIMKKWKITSDRDYLEMGSLRQGLYLIRVEGGAAQRIIKQ